MEPQALLQQVAQTYRALKSLRLEVISATETGDAEQSNRSQQRTRILFSAPDKARVESGGSHASISVTNGVDLHHYSSFDKGYSRTPIEGRDVLPGLFRPEFPTVCGPIFFFSRIADRVSEARFLLEESISVDGAEVPCHVLSVRYEPLRHAGPVSFSPVIFWVDSRTHLIVRSECEAAHRSPMSDQLHAQKHIVNFTKLEIDPPVSSDAFDFTPPPDAEDASNPRRLRSGLGMGSSHFRGDTKTYVESFQTADWVGDSYVEECRLKLRGFDFTFERRMTFSEDLKELRVAEKIYGPRGQAEHGFSVPTS